ncbi:MAG: VCBS repeat-containing protein, partial [Planctomycetota bacterium]
MTTIALCILACSLLLGCQPSSQLGIAPGSVSAEESHQVMVDTLVEIASRANDENRYVGDRMARKLRSELKATPADAAWLTRWLKTYQLAKTELNLGNEDEAIRLYESAAAVLGDNSDQLKPEIVRQFYFDIAVGHLRMGESQNCCQQHTSESCIVPIQGRAVHTNPEGSRNGIQWLTKLLGLLDDDDPMQLATRWLLNLAYMTLGEYPDSVPQEYLIPDIGAVANAESSTGQTQPWRNVAAQAGLATFSLAGGAIADDFDGDGDIDLVVSSYDPRVSLKIFWNDGTGKFSEGTEAANLNDILGGLNMVQTDFNNDGHIDIFVMRGGWLASGGQHPNSLLRNNGDGTFTDITITAGLALPKLPTQTAAWADFDLDGDLDVYIGNESTESFAAASQLFCNNGDETFTDVTARAGVTNDLLAKSVVWGDYDGDRYPDLYVSNYRGPNRLYHNNGDGTFEDVAGRLQVTGPKASFPSWFCDVNQDGRLDLFVSAYAG